MDKYKRNVQINSKKRLRKDTGAACTTNPARWRLGAELLEVAGMAPTELQELGGGSQSQPTT